MKTLRVDRQYSTGLSRHNIEQALVATGKDRKHIRPADLGVLEDFHTLGRAATRQLAEITSHDRVLDADSGSETGLRPLLSVTDRPRGVLRNSELAQ